MAFAENIALSSAVIAGLAVLQPVALQRLQDRRALRHTVRQERLSSYATVQRLLYQLTNDCLATISELSGDLTSGTVSDRTILNRVFIRKGDLDAAMAELFLIADSRVRDDASDCLNNFAAVCNSLSEWSEDHSVLHRQSAHLSLDRASGLIGNLQDSMRLELGIEKERGPRSAFSPARISELVGPLRPASNPAVGPTASSRPSVAMPAPPQTPPTTRDRHVSPTSLPEV